MESLGFSNLIIANSIYKPDILNTTVERMREYGFKRFFFTLDHDVTSRTISHYLEKRKQALKTIKEIIPRGCYYDVIPSIAASKDSIYEKQISRLSFKKTRYLPLQFPVFEAFWIDAALRYLLYGRNKKPLFISFERNIATYDPGYIRRIVKNRSAAFMIDINSFANPNAIPHITSIIEKGSPIVLGLSSPIEDYPSLDIKMNYFKSVVGQDAYTKLILNSNKSSQSVFGLK